MGADIAQPAQKLFLSRAQLQARVRELGAEIALCCAQQHIHSVLAITLLRGGVVFFADLVRALPPSLDVRFSFAGVSSYGNLRQSNRQPRWTVPLTDDVRNLHVLLIDDIVDTGLSLAFVRQELLARGAASVRICTLLDKRSCRETQVPIEHTGFMIPDQFVVGSGMDDAGKLRHLDGIFLLA